MAFWKWRIWFTTSFFAFLLNVFLFTWLFLFFWYIFIDTKSVWENQRKTRSYIWLTGLSGRLCVYKLQAVVSQWNWGNCQETHCQVKAHTNMCLHERLIITTRKNVLAHQHTYIIHKLFLHHDLHHTLPATSVIKILWFYDLTFSSVNTKITRAR